MREICIFGNGKSYALISLDPPNLPIATNALKNASYVISSATLSSLHNDLITK